MSDNPSLIKVQPISWAQKTVFLAIDYQYDWGHGISGIRVCVRE